MKNEVKDYKDKLISLLQKKVAEIDAERKEGDVPGNAMWVNSQLQRAHTYDEIIYFVKNLNNA